MKETKKLFEIKVYDTKEDNKYVKSFFMKNKDEGGVLLSVKQYAERAYSKSKDWDYVVNEVKRTWTPVFEIQNSIDYTVEELIGTTKWLARDLTTLSEGLTFERENCNFNSLGEIQSVGNKIDNLLGKLSALKEGLRVATSLMKENQALRDED